MRRRILYDHPVKDFVVLLEISFTDHHLQRECESEPALRRAYGDDCARRIRARLADLDAAANLHEFRSLPGGCRELDGADRGKLVLKLAAGKQLVLTVAGAEHDAGIEASLEWQTIEAVQILAITNDTDNPGV